MEKRYHEKNKKIYNTLQLVFFTGYSQGEIIFLLS
jgi:hypothetical protein